MSLSALSIDRHLWSNQWKEKLELTAQVALAKDNHYTLFRSEDLSAWITFSVIFVCLLTFDNAILHRSPKAMTIGKACAYTVFWIMCAVGYFGWIYWWKGSSSAWMWMSGYMLEWMLSFDNLFVFHMIFSVYQTPDHLKHRPLYLGICGAVFFRLVFIFVGEYLMHAMFVMHFVFGAFLVYTGVKTAATDDDDEDPSQQPVVQWLQNTVPFVSIYDEQGAFFVRVPVDDRGEAMLPNCPGNARQRHASTSEANSISAAECGQEKPRYGTIDMDASVSKAFGGKVGKTQMRATMLFLVVCCLEVSDLLFAVDSVSAVVAQVNDLFLAYTSAVFAMLGLRATFFIIDMLAKLFSLLKYGVATVLVFIGIKLIITRWVHISSGITCVVLVSCISLSVVASVIQAKLNPSDDSEDETPAAAAQLPAPPAVARAA